MENIESIFNISVLIAREMTGEINDKERESLHQWLNRSERNRTVYRQIVEGENLSERNLTYNSIDVNQAWGKMSPSLTGRNKMRTVRNLFWKYAASILLVAGLGAATYYFFPRQSDIEQFAATPGERTENAELVLADGQRVEIDSKQSKIEYSGDGSSVSLNDTSRLDQSKSASENSFNEIIIPYGKRLDIILSDGSRVWLNSGSRLVFPPAFNGKVREVFLEGEACFEVSRNENKPFFVRTSAFRVKVLGTKFLVQAYKEENEFTTVLLEGRVNLAQNDKLFAKEFELLPNQKASFKGNEENFEITDVQDVENYIAWIDGYLNFEREDIYSVARRISRYYNIEIEVEGPVEKLKFSGKLDLKESPERILNSLATIFKTSYEKRENKFVFVKK